MSAVVRWDEVCCDVNRMWVKFVVVNLYGDCFVAVLIVF